MQSTWRLKLADIWVTSDTHFNHANILKFRGQDGDTIRPFKEVQEMNETMIQNWNSVVKPQDKIYHLGDVFFGDREKDGPPIMERLNGHKRLVVGNHDRIKGGPHNNVLQRYFEKIYLWRMMPEFGLLMTHVPVHPSTLDEGRFEDNNGEVRMINVHGHIHQNPSPPGPYRCVCVDHEGINYTPVHIDRLRIK